MPTTFSSAKVTGALTVVGTLTAGVVALTTLAATTGTFTTVRTQTLSGASLRNNDASITIDSTDLEVTSTISGATLRTTAGDTIIDANGVTSIDRLSGGKLVVNATSAGSGFAVISGSVGGVICMFDTDSAGWTACDALNGTLTCGIAAAAICP
jgi:hypothetical protein